MTTVPMRIAAIFDLDDTLVAGVTGKMVVKYLRQTGQMANFVRRREMLAILAQSLLFKYGFTNATAAMQVTVRVCRGRTVEEMWELVNRWFDEMVKDALAPGALLALNWHREQGHILVICTASSQFSALPVARHLGMQHAIFTEWESKDGRMTGSVRLPIAYGAGKVHLLRHWADQQGVDLRRSYFYSDHHSDLPMLELVEHPVAVNPTRRLRSLAEWRCWPIKVWR
jgi:HAD superfamily hydrolase (TIGR01490 family)